jgi:hypothetical protein
MNNPLPKITFIIVKKRHNTRFFVREPNVKMMNNVQPGKSILIKKTFVWCLYLLGTVVDTGIVHPQGFDFYLNSHAAIQGRVNFRKRNVWKEIFFFKEHHDQFYIMFYTMKSVFHLMKFNRNKTYSIRSIYSRYHVVCLKKNIWQIRKLWWFCELFMWELSWDFSDGSHLLFWRFSYFFYFLFYICQFWFKERNSQKKKIGWKEILLFLQESNTLYKNISELI